jgi:addiction module HigA family antidote
VSNKTSIIKPITAASAGAQHPGQYIRDTVLTPNKMSVTAAAKIVGVGRPALSNFLNGHVAATPDMASRIERAFSVPAQTLLDMQAAFSAAQAKSKGAPANTKAYVPPFLGIKANEIEAWASSNITARIRLSVLLRTLVNSTGVGLTKVDFPGNDDAQRPGWDGFIEVAEGTPWIPEGLSGWEFGTNQDIKGKADKDFAKSVKATTIKAERDQTTFVFVTPRRWPGKDEWVNDRKAQGQWKDVRAYDASDVEQWLEQSIAGQAWFANETIRPSNGVRSLDKCWSDWATVASPPLAGDLFAPAIDGAKRTMESRLSKPPEEPTVIAADSTEEALAFLAQLFGEAGEELAVHRDRVLVFDEPGVLPKLAQGAQNFIAVATTRDVERELAPFARSMHTIVVYPRNAANADPHMVLEPLNYGAFRTSLEEMGYGRDDIDKFSNESGRSLTVLRRRLSNVPAVRTPAWAGDDKTAASLVPFLFIGAWSSTNEADQTALMRLANENSYGPLEKECQRLARLNDAPVWSVGTYRGVISKIDLLFAVAGSITPQDLKRYLEMAKIVLSEDDPKLDLPESERWAASFHGKSREYSAALREGISETLVLLAVHGNHLFQGRLGFDAEAEAALLVRGLMTPLTTRTLEANDHDLPTYAEAAPEEFLSILEKDLKTDEPATIGLMRPVASDVFGGGCVRTGLLWALEDLAWNPATLPRAALILAQLAEVEIDDNWGNKPIASLETIFRAWMPQTAANHDQRLAAIKLLAEKYPNVAWKVCVEQFDTRHRIGHYSHKPRWRTDAHGFGEPFATWTPINAFKREMIEMALSWKNHTREMLGDLVERLHDLDDKQRTAVWTLVMTWADAGASDIDKAWVREKIRVTVMSRRGVKRAKTAAGSDLSTAAKAAYEALEPSDLLSKHEWLFRETWIQESADELHDDDMDYHKRDERIAKQRADALQQIIAAHGMKGVFELAEMGKAASQIGTLMVTNVLEEAEISDFLLGALPPASNKESWAKKNLVLGALRALQDQKKRTRVLKKSMKKLSQADQARLLLLAPFRKSTWRIVDGLDEAHRQVYWEEIAPAWADQSDKEFNEAVERLLAAQRPRAAFAFLHIDLEKIKPRLLYRLMSDMAKEGGKDQPGQYQLDSHYIEQAFSLIDKSAEVTLDQKAGLEFAYIDALSKPWREEGYGIPNLEKYVEAHPELYVQAVVWTYPRSGEGEDPKEWQIAPKDVQNFVERGYKLLDAIGRIPGHDDLGELNADSLAAWVKTVRDACAELGRLEVADSWLGRLFAGAPSGEDGVWPSEPVRRVMEDIQSKEMSRGAHTGLYNARGVHTRGEGGNQERVLAEKYRAWAHALQYSHPFLASTLLMGMVRTYEHDANREDTEAGIRRRLR